MGAKKENTNDWIYVDLDNLWGLKKKIRMIGYMLTWTTYRG